jgi:hypothetical protein
VPGTVHEAGPLVHHQVLIAVQHRSSRSTARAASVSVRAADIDLRAGGEPESTSGAAHRPPARRRPDQPPARAREPTSSSRAARKPSSRWPAASRHHRKRHQISLAGCPRVAAAVPAAARRAQADHSSATPITMTSARLNVGQCEVNEVGHVAIAGSCRRFRDAADQQAERHREQRAAGAGAARATSTPLRPRPRRITPAAREDAERDAGVA